MSGVGPKRGAISASGTGWGCHAQLRAQGDDPGDALCQAARGLFGPGVGGRLLRA